MYRYVTPVQSRTRTRQFAFVTIAAFALIGIDVLSHGGIREKLVPVAAAVHAGIQNTGAAISEIGIFTSRTSLVSENVALREENARYKSLALSAEALRAENEALARMAHLSGTRPGVTATIAGGESSLGTFLVSAGSRDGVAMGDLVRTDNGFVIGTVIEVHDTVSFCRSLFAPNTSIDVVINGTHIALEGRGAGNARGKVLPSVAISDGDVATAASVRGYPIAIVGHIDADASDGFKEVYVRSPADISTIRYVYIERP